LSLYSLSFHHWPPCHNHFLTPPFSQPSCLCPSAAGNTNGLLEGKTQKPSSGFTKFQILQFEILRHIKLHSGYICFQTHHKNQPNPSQREFDEIEREWKATHNQQTLYFIFIFIKIIFLLFYFNFFFSLLISLFFFVSPLW
jgi:hypothetical protein